MPKLSIKFEIRLKNLKVEISKKLNDCYHNILKYDYDYK